ncbi:MAG: putative MATE family efflux protein, partial [Oceanospirillaceae bacterium]
MTKSITEFSSTIEGDENKTKPHEMLTAPVFKLFIKMAIPIIVGLLVNGLYNFVDAIFIARAVGTQAIGGVSAAFPVHMVLISISAMMAGGMASVLSRQLGAGHHHHANTVFSSALFFAFIVGIVSSFLILVFKVEIFQLMRLPPALQIYAIEYIVPIALFSSLSFCSGVVSDAFRAEGKAIQMMKVMALSSILNIVFDALFLFVFEWGVAGAAWATVLAIAISFAYSIQILLTSEHRIQFEMAQFKWHWQYNKQALSLGVPIFLSYTGYVVMLAAVNFAIVNVAGDEADLLISGHGIFNRTFMLIFLPVLG